MAKEVKLKMTLDEKGAVTSIEKVGERFKRMKGSGKSAGMAGNAGMLKIAAGAAIAFTALRVIGRAYRALSDLIEDSITKTAQQQDTIAKLSHKIGVGTETLSAYRLATELSGTTMEVFAVGLRTAIKNAYDMTQGTGEAKDAFEELGITVTEENGKMKSGEEIMLAVADKLMLLDDASRRTALAQKIFGRSGTELLPMMEKGRAGIEAMKEEARALGITFTDETAAASEEYNDSLARMNAGFEGLKMRIGNAVIPALTQVIQAVMRNEEFMNLLTRTAEFLGRTIQNTIVIASRALAFWIGDFFGGLLNVLSLFRIYDKQLEEGARTAKSWGKSLEDIAFRVENISFVLPKATGATAGFNDELGETPEIAAKAVSALDEWNAALLASSHYENIEVKPGAAPPGLESIFGNLEAAKAAAKEKQDELEGISSGLSLPQLLPNIPGIETGENPIVLFAEQALGPLDLLKNAALEMGNAGAQAFGQWARGAGTLGVALRQATVQVLANLATQAFAGAMMEIAYALAALAWGNIPKATAHFRAAAQFGLVAGLSGLAARGMSGGEGGMGAPGSASNPAYIQTSPQAANQQIYSDQAGVLVEIKDVLTRIKTLPAGQVVFDGIQQNGGVAALMNDNDKSALGGEFLDSRYARR